MTDRISIKHPVGVYCDCGRGAKILLRAKQKRGKKVVRVPLCVECARLLTGKIDAATQP